jgi:excisionase family DNA binding protein
MNAMPGEIEWLSTKEACERLGVTLRTLYRLMDEGQIPAYKIGRLLKLKGEDIATFIEGARIQPGDLKHLYPSDSSETEPAGT